MAIEDKKMNDLIEEGELDPGRPEEREAEAVVRRLSEIEEGIKKLKEYGVKSLEEIGIERNQLENEYKIKLEKLKKQVGENISEESANLIHKNIVDEVIAFRKHVLEKYQFLIEKIKDPVLKAALEAESIRDFKQKLSAASKDKGTFENKKLKDAKKHLEMIMPGHEDYMVKKELPKIYEGDTVGMTEMDSDGGGEVTISAEHLASISSKEGQADVNRTLKHEEIHQKQARLDEDAEGTVVVDPKSGQKITETLLHEGGAVHGTKDLDGHEEAGNIYKKGLDFFKLHNAATINEHLEKKGRFAGDRVHLQAELIKEAKITDPKKIDEIAKDAGFSEEEKKKLLKLLKNTNKQSENLPIEASS